MAYPRGNCLNFSLLVDDKDAPSRSAGCLFHADCLDKGGRLIAEQRIWQLLLCFEIRIGFWRIR